METKLKDPLVGRFPWAPVLVIILIGIAAYLTSLSGEFIWDDVHFISDNTYLRSPSYLPLILTGDVAAGSGEVYNYYRPLTTVTYLFDFSFWGLNPVGYHISGILLHILVGVAVYFFLQVLFRDPLIALIAALLYLVHPIQTETVAYISGRPDSLAVLCMMACFIAYVKQQASGSIPLLFISIFLYLLALLSRENSVVLPGLLILYHISFRKPIRFSGFLPLAVLAGVYIVMRALLMDKAVIPTTLIERLPGFFYAITGYLRLILLPVDLHQEYGFLLFAADRLRVLAGIMIAAGGVLLAIWCWRRRKGNIFFFSVFWFFISISPVAGVYPIKAYIAEHWLYLPSIGIFTVLAAGYAFLIRRGRYRFGLIGLGVVGILFYGSLTAKQNRYFHEPLTFYERTLAYTPDSARMHNNLGNIYFTRGRVEEAVRSYREAIRLEPDYPNPYNNLGNVFYRSGDYDSAVPLFIQAIKLNQGYSAAYNNLGIIYCRRGETEEGIRLLKRSATLNPNDADTLYNLGVIYDMTGRPDDAAAAYRQSLRVMPNIARVHSRLAQTLRALGENAQADYHLTRAKELGGE
jgi:protein O-mannosyl-transferase